MAEKKEFKITPQGSLGILALGDVGILAWREVKNKAIEEKEKNKKDKDNGEEADK